MCLFASIGDAFTLHDEIFHCFSHIVLILNCILLIIFLCELKFLRKVAWCDLPHAYLMVLFAIASSVISSLFFVLTSSRFGAIFCSFGPIIAISFRTLAKTFTWALYIVRGQMVMESLDSILIRKLAKYAPFILVFQYILITLLITIFTETKYISTEDECDVFYPLWLLICSALIGEIFYGLGFLYIFYKAMIITMSHVYKSLSKSVAEKTKEQIHHHIKVYVFQLISSLIFLFFVSLCICFQTLIFFEFELFISNLCLLLLFRHRYKLFKKVVSSAKKCCCCTNKPEICDDLKPDRADFSRHRILSEINDKSTITSPKLLANKWRSSKEVINMKHALNAHTMPKSARNNIKVLQLMGVNDGATPKISPKFHTFSSESITTIQERINTDSEPLKNINTNINSHFRMQSMSDPFRSCMVASELQSIPSNNAIYMEEDENKNCGQHPLQQLAHSQSQQLLQTENKLKKRTNEKSTVIGRRFSSLLDRFKKYEANTCTNGDDEKKVDILSLSDPLTSIHQNDKKKLKKKQSGQHAASLSVSHIKVINNANEVDFIDSFQL